MNKYNFNKCKQYMHIYFSIIYLKWRCETGQLTCHGSMAGRVAELSESILLPDEPFKPRSLKWAGNTFLQRKTEVEKCGTVALLKKVWGERQKSRNTHTQALVISEGRCPGHVPSGTSQTQTSWIKPNVRIHRSPNNIQEICPPATFSRVIKGGLQLLRAWLLTCRRPCNKHMSARFSVMDCRLRGEGGGGTGNRMTGLYIFHWPRHRCRRLTISVVKGQNTFTLEAAVTAANQ